MAMRFSRFQIALLGATPGLAALALSRGMTGECGRRCASLMADIHGIMMLQIAFKP